METAKATAGETKMDMTSYNTCELKNAVDMDAWAVRLEATRRANAAEKKIAKYKAAIAKAEAEISECAKAMNAAYEVIAA